MPGLDGLGHVWTVVPFVSTRYVVVSSIGAYSRNPGDSWARASVAATRQTNATRQSDRARFMRKPLENCFTNGDAGSARNQRRTSEHSLLPRGAGARSPMARRFIRRKHPPNLGVTSTATI